MGMNLPGLPVGPLGETLTTGHLCSAGLFPQASRLRGSRGTPPGEAHQSGCALAINPLTRSWPPPDPQQALSFQEGLPDWTVRCRERQEGPGLLAGASGGCGRWGGFGEAPSRVRECPSTPSITNRTDPPASSCCRTHGASSARPTPAPEALALPHSCTQLCRSSY